MLTEDQFKNRVDRLIKDITNDDLRNHFQYSINTLYKNNIKNYQDLLVAINSNNLSAEVRCVACWLTARIGDDDSLSVLLLAISDISADVRAEAIRSIGLLRFTSQNVLDIIIQRLSTDSDLDVRTASAYTLGMLEHSNALIPLLNTLNNNNEHPSVRGMAAESLINFKDLSVIPPLIVALSDKFAEVRYWSAYALGVLGAKEALSELERLSVEDHEELQNCGKVSDEAKKSIEMIYHILNHPD